ncbi:unnamed protein product, partial [Ectocarpus sp. 12 AP-2014]
MALPDSLKNRLSLPLVAAPMFLISGPELALACCKQGIVGSFPALNQRTSEGFEQWLIQMNNELEALLDADPDHPPAPYA